MLAEDYERQQREQEQQQQQQPLLLPPTLTLSSWPLSLVKLKHQQLALLCWTFVPVGNPLF